LVDLERLKPGSVQPPKVLMQMCLGYLKLAAVDDSLKAFLVAKKQSLAAVVEAWLQGDTPIELEASRVLLKFLTRLEIPN